MEKEHRQRLQKLWLKLLENVTDYKGVIGGLFTENILTPAMKERVELKQGSDQLREILDILPKRGPRAFSVFYQVLVDCGEDVAADLLCPELADQRLANAALKPAPCGVRESAQQPMALPEEDELPAKWPDHTLHDPFRVEVTTVAENNTMMRALFDRALAGSGSAFAMHKPTRGIFLLIGNQYFKEARANGEELGDRDGTGKDTIALDALFRQLHFQVVTKVNLTAQEMLEAVRLQAIEVHPTDNCFACAILTHGERGVVFGVDGKTVALDELKAAVTDTCLSLIGKPKIFFIQACQGKKLDNGEAATGGQGDVTSETGKNEDQELVDKFAGVRLRDPHQSDAAPGDRVSPKSDIFVAMATVPDFVSWRNTNWGTWFVQAVAYIFSRFAHKYHIGDLMTRVNKLVSKAETSKGYKQVSMQSTSLTSDFFFFPGLQHGVIPESHSEIDFNKGSNDVSAEKGIPQQTATLEPRQDTTPVSQPMTEGGSITAQPTDGVDGDKSVLVE